MHASKMARGEEAYQGKLLEARQSDWKDEFGPHNAQCCPMLVLAWAVLSDDPGAAMEKIKLFFDTVLSSSRHGSQICGSLS